MTFRILEKYYDHETNTRYAHHNKPIDQNIEAYRLGIVSRMMANEIEAIYSKENPLRLSWEMGWNFYSTHFLSGKRGVIYEKGEVPPSQISAALEAQKKAKKGKKAESEQRKPLEGQKNLPIVEEDELDSIVDKIQKQL